MDTSNLKKIFVNLEPDAWHGFATESVWAEPSGSNFKIKNSPFYAKGISFEDVVEAAVDESGKLIYQRTVQAGGHSTYRIILKVQIDSTEFAASWNTLGEIGCTYEGADAKLLAVDIPAATDVKQAYALLEEGEKAGVWEFEEGHVGHQI